MSKATTDDLPRAEYLRGAALDPGRTDLSAEDVGSAVPEILSSVAAVGRARVWVAAFDRPEFMDRIGSEVDAARADRP